MGGTRGNFLTPLAPAVDRGREGKPLLYIYNIYKKFFLIIYIYIKYYPCYPSLSYIISVLRVFICRFYRKFKVESTTSHVLRGFSRCYPSLSGYVTPPLPLCYPCYPSNLTKTSLTTLTSQTYFRNV